MRTSRWTLSAGGSTCSGAMLMQILRGGAREGLLARCRRCSSGNVHEVAGHSGAAICDSNGAVSEHSCKDPLSRLRVILHQLSALPDSTRPPISGEMRNRDQKVESGIGPKHVQSQVKVGVR